jgi:hypothetical protein
MHTHHHLENLEARRLFAITASFNPAGGGVLAVTGDNNANTIVVSRNVAGQLFVNGGARQRRDGRHHRHDQGLRQGRQRHRHARRDQRRPA